MRQGMPVTIRTCQKISCKLPVGSYRSMGIHESQSLFFEMQLGRSPAFLSLLRPLITRHLANGDDHPAFSQETSRKFTAR